MKYVNVRLQEELDEALDGCPMRITMNVDEEGLVTDLVLKGDNGRFLLRIRLTNSGDILVEQPEPQKSPKRIEKWRLHGIVGKAMLPVDEVFDSWVAGNIALLDRYSLWENVCSLGLDKIFVDEQGNRVDN